MRFRSASSGMRGPQASCSLSCLLIGRGWRRVSIALVEARHEDPTMSPDGARVHLRRPAKPASRLGDDIDLVGAFGVLLSRDGKAIIYGPRNGDVRGCCPVLEAVEITERSTGRAFF